MIVTDNNPTRFIRIAGSAIAAGSLLLLASCATKDDGPRVQNWTNDQFDRWAYGTQGSRLIPYSWFNALEQAGNQSRFLEANHMSGFGFLPAPEGAPSDLPIGLAIDEQSDKNLVVTKLRWQESQGTKASWVGFNCAACHTGAIEYGGENIRIAGAPAMLDFQKFVRSLDAALDETATDSAKFDRFATNVLAEKDNAANRALLMSSLGKLVAWQQKSANLNQTEVDYGFARVDAFGHIYNKTIQFSADGAAIGNPPNAPVSYPFLWNIWRQNKVQWNGAVENAKLKLGGDKFLDYGALGRNAGEVIGVFGEIIIEPASTNLQLLKGYKSSIQADNLDRFETQLRQLEPPKWPVSMNSPEMDAGERESLAAKGKTLFAGKCASCHLPQEQWEEGEPIERMITFQSMIANDKPTDIWMACNAFTYSSPTGKLEGTKIGYVSGEEYGKRANVIDMLSTSVKGSLVGKKGEIIKSAAAIFLGLSRKPKVFPVPEAVGVEDPARALRADLCLTTKNPLLAYKARPLDGIWATAPYLHNGSVPTLYHLLLPSAQRPKRFWVGSRKYDSQRLGYVWDSRDGERAFEFVTHNAAGNPIPGNSNEGHEYGAAGFSEEDRSALLEYMKTL